MTVTSLPQHYRGGGSHETMVSFSYKIWFQEHGDKNKEDGENDVDAIVIYGRYVQLTDCNSILEKKRSLVEWASNFGYYELDDDTKFSIVHNTNDECLYTRGAHFGWHKVDPNDLIDYPRNRVQMVRDKVGYEIMLTTGGHRKSKESSMNTSIVDNCILP